MNLFKLFVTSDAEQDADEVAEFYESKQPELGDKFIEELYKKLELLKQHPEMYAKFEKEIRRGNLKDFPYSFYYENDMPEELVNVLGVFAQAKNPKSIRRTLASRIKLRKL